MSKSLLSVKDLHATVDNKAILKGLNLEIRPGETHVIMGPNGAGKSTLANVIMGNPVYPVEGGEIIFDGKDITEESTDKRAKDGIFLSFQNSEEVPGVTLESFLRTAKSIVTDKEVRVLAFRKELYEYMEMLDMGSEYASRYLNVGFSGGEKKKSEILQLLILNPKLAILDETDSGLDVDAVKTVSDGINKYHNEENSVLIITHNTRMIEQLKPDYVHVLVDGKIVRTGDSSLADAINEEGFAIIE